MGVQEKRSQPALALAKGQQLLLVERCMVHYWESPC